MTTNDAILLELQKITQGQKLLEEEIKGVEKRLTQKMQRSNQDLDKKFTQKIEGLEEKLTQKMQESNQDLEKRLTQKMQESNQDLEKRLTKKINDSQTDTIDVLSDLIHTGYNIHEKRIKQLEKII